LHGKYAIDVCVIICSLAVVETNVSRGGTLG